MIKWNILKLKSKNNMNVGEFIKHLKSRKLKR